MIERERHRKILLELESSSVATIAQLVSLIGCSEATIRRDVLELSSVGKLKRIRGGVEVIQTSHSHSLVSSPFLLNQSIHTAEKQAIAKRAAEMCEDGESIIIGGGSTAFYMAQYFENKVLNVMTNSFVVAEYLHHNSRCNVTLPSGKLYKEQNLVLSSYPEDGVSNFFAAKVFFGAQGVSPLGALETDSLIIQGTTRLLRQATSKILLADSSKFEQFSNMIICPLADIDYCISDQQLKSSNKQMLSASDVTLIQA
ncbi:DeoR/GlpR family DNA-binding transcription regulator [Agarivorans sp. TSD2052]|uniref:DeoR/GlpR family DNA-binding transcription regulator n=1 Tax=Agarivorans sp. TSD2052 TaxID=2937286 RepID=UPI00200CA758|nr:DeoR/GlpR family DNA-binding transcription regulator [Agarivorans sp. TSD2052]UPW18814.1 DeoR/GlpR family DNA-binding transcription regulator [Agarivorans sp. TSD2052]